MNKADIIKDFDNKLFNRRELEFSINAEVTPSYKEVKELIAKEFSADLEVIKINLIKGQFGTNDFLIKAHIYKTPDDLISTEKKSKRELALEKPVESSVEEVPAEEKPVKEEKKEENPVEDKSVEEKKDE